jgi:magnesium transporter
MIRSLVAPADHAEQDEFILRRNLTQEKLEDAYRAGDFLWLDVVEPENKEIDWVGRFFQLSPSVMDDLYRTDRRPSLLIYPSYLFLSLIQPQVKQMKVESSEIHCILGERYFITVRGSNSTAVEDAYNRAAQDTALWLKGLPYFLYLACQAAIDTYYPLLDRISNQLNRIEEQLMLNTDGVANPRQTVYGAKQQLIAVRQMIAPQREVLSNLLGEARLTEEDVRDLFRHLYERLLRVYDLIDAQRDLSSNVLDMMENQESKRMVDAVNRLTIFSMIFLPLTFLSGLFELNFVTTPDPLTLPLNGRVMFVLVLSLMVVSAGGMFWFLRRRGWL